MSRRSPAPWRDHLPFRRPEPHFKWRGDQVSRLENLGDAVFAIALALLIVATEVPRTFAELMRVLRDFPAFAACFALLMLFWNAHYRYFRRYGLEDLFTRSINYVVLLLVLFSVYPLKFLFSSWLGSGAGNAFESKEQLYFLYRTYGIGFAGIWTLFALLQWHALRLRHELRLSPIELLYTRLTLTEFLISIALCLLSISLTYLAVPSWLPGVIYALTGPLFGWNGWWHGRQIEALAAAAPTSAARSDAVR